MRVLVIRTKGLEPHLLRGARKQRGREIRHHIKAPSWLEEALAGRILSEEDGDPPVPGGGEEWLGIG